MKTFLASLAISLATLSLNAVPANGNTEPWAYRPNDHLSGIRLDERHLCDMVVLVAEFDLDHMNMDALKKLGEAVTYRKGRRYCIVGSMRGRKLSPAKFSSFIASCQFSLNKEMSFYNDFGLKENEPQSETYPFYYVAGMRGEIYYNGADVDEAIKTVQAKGPSRDREHPIFGAAEPVKLQAITNQFEVGKSARAGIAWLKKMAFGKDPEIAHEAKHFLAAINQKRIMNLADLRTLSDTQPAICAWKLEQLLKMWPEMKNDKYTLEMRENLKANPQLAALAKIVCSCEAEAQKPILRPAQAKTTVKFYQSFLPRLEKIKGSDDSSIAYEASKYATRLDELIAAAQEKMQ